MGSFIDGDGKRTRIGSAITREAGRDGGNFLHPDIERLVRRTLIYRERGAMIDAARLRQNLLSSMPLAFNVFGPLALDLSLATRTLHELLPGTFREVTGLAFEHSPGRGKAAFTADYSAFDVAIRGLSPTGQRTFVGIEVKYSETMTEAAPDRYSDRLTEIAVTSDLFVDADWAPLWRTPLQQLLREHLLAQSMLQHGLYDHAAFMVLAPRDNHLVNEATTTYAGFLHPERPDATSFLTFSLEHFIEALSVAGAAAYARALHHRYDFTRLDALLFPDDGPPAHRRPPELLAAPVG